MHFSKIILVQKCILMSHCTTFESIENLLRDQIKVSIGLMESSFFHSFFNFHTILWKLPACPENVKKVPNGFESCTAVHLNLKAVWKRNTLTRVRWGIPAVFGTPVSVFHISPKPNQNAQILEYINAS